LIDFSHSARAAHRGEKKDLLSRITDAPSSSPSSSTPAASSKKKTPKTERKRLPALTGTMGAPAADSSTSATPTRIAP
jgi:hypothetical protein